MTDLPLVEKATCTCGHHDDDLPTLDAREIPHAIRHASILGALGSLKPGGAMALIAPHNPLPLLGQIKDAYGDSVEISYLEEGPDAWKLRFARV
ncbi:DUF2249 domain-containing protein [Kribbia dieselivorans]|uniref:DUF2249 domain-containing protein n=1 Tax=Kribbia dieselivorans TaxID=331526 RepID=UPI000837D9B5|nr:DUF2249 domain-containing protein [Kribbia dieselivorans]